MKKLLIKMYENSVVRYIFAGGCTTLVNIVTFAILRKAFNVDMTLSNFISIFLAIIFAFVVNKGFVFRSETKGAVGIMGEFAAFFGGRLFTMIIEIVGVSVLTKSMGIDDIISKLLTQVIVLVLNFVISKFFVFGKAKVQENKSVSQWVKDNIVYVLAIGVPTFLMLGVWIVGEVSPFGGKSLIIVDGLHQYIPFFSEYYNKIVNGGSMLYSWSGGLGHDYITLWSYYLSSPFNILMLLFDQEYLNQSVGLIVSIKIILSSFAFAYYMVNRSMLTLDRYIPNDNEKMQQSILIRKKDIRIAIFAVGYGLSNFVIGYYWNVMWMDCIMILPIIILGLDRLMRKGDCRLYIFTLFYSLFCNFFMSFMICIFLVLWAFTYDFDGIKEMGKRALQFICSSIIAAAMSAFALIPTYIGLNQTASGKRTLPDSEWYVNVFDLLKAHMSFYKPIKNQTFDGGVNLYCGIFAVMLAILYFFIKKIPITKRIRYGIIIAMFILSFNNTTLNYIWHGFHNQYGIPNRFSFIYIFIILVLGYDALCYLKTVKIWRSVIAYLFSISLFVASYYITEDTVKKEAYITTFVLLTVYFVIIMIYSYKVFPKKVFIYIVTGIALVELVGNGIYGFASNGNVTISSYFDNTKAIKEITESFEKSDDSFYRVDVAKHKMLDEAIWHNLKCVGIFGSTASGNMVTMMGKLGFYTGANEYLYRGATPLTNAIFSVKYVLYRDGDTNTSNFNYCETVDGVQVFENPYYLPIAFGVNSNIVSWGYTESGAYDVQNNFVKTATGEGDIFDDAIMSSYIVGNNCTVTKNADKSISYDRTSTSNCSVSEIFTADKDMDLYVNCTGSNIKKVNISIDGDLLSSDRNHLQTFRIGEINKGQVIQIQIELTDGASDTGSVKALCAVFNQTNFENAYEDLSQYPMEVLEYGDDFVKGYVNFDTEKVLFTSIPYSKGWTVYIDGEKAETISIGNAFLGVEISGGEHTIEMKYFPEGLKEGLLISTVGIFIYILYCFVCYKRKKVI